LAALRDDLEEIYRRHAAAVFRRARRLMTSDADAQDVVHDVFLSLFERPQQFSGRSSLTTFLYSNATHACLSRIRNAKNRERLLKQLSSEHAPATGQPPALMAQLHLHRVLISMPEQLARVAVYAWLDELSHAEIAELVGCSRRHVSNLLNQIDAWIRQQEEPSCC
jgi:RNA polymerase sigma factor (sigma-70 family)